MTGHDADGPACAMCGDPGRHAIYGAELDVWVWRCDPCFDGMIAAAFLRLEAADAAGEVA